MKPPVLFGIALAGILAILSAVHVYLLDGIAGWLCSCAFVEDTVYAEGYSDAAFRRVRRGMSEADVLGILSAPLGEVWSYASSPSTSLSKISLSDGVIDHIDGSRGGSGSVTQISIGMRRDEVLRSLGEPLEKSLIYSRSQHDQSYRVRIVVVSPREGALRKVSYFYVD